MLHPTHLPTTPPATPLALQCILDLPPHILLCMAHILQAMVIATTLIAITHTAAPMAAPQALVAMPLMPHNVSSMIMWGTSIRTSTTHLDTESHTTTMPNNQETSTVYGLTLIPTSVTHTAATPSTSILLKQPLTQYSGASPGMFSSILTHTLVNISSKAFSKITNINPTTNKEMSNHLLTPLMCFLLITFNSNSWT